VIMMRTESNREPEQIEIRKLGVTNGEPVVYLYLNSDIKQVTEPDIDDKPHTKYTYNMMQITNPIPATLQPEIDTALIAQHGYNQTSYKQKTMEHLDKIKAELMKITTVTTRHVDRLDNLTTLTQGDIENIKTRITMTLEGGF